MVRNSTTWWMKSRWNSVSAATKLAPWIADEEGAQGIELSAAISFLSDTIKGLGLATGTGQIEAPRSDALTSALLLDDAAVRVQKRRIGRRLQSQFEPARFIAARTIRASVQKR